jgi:hypothetical protein
MRKTLLRGGIRSALGTFREMRVDPQDLFGSKRPVRKPREQLLHLIVRA